MIFFTLLVIAVSAIEIWIMKKSKKNKEILVFILLALLSLSLGYFYLSDPYRESLAQNILNLFAKDY